MTTETQTPAEQASEPSSSRPYLIFERASLRKVLDQHGFDIDSLPDAVRQQLEQVRVYRHISTATARNGEHAVRQAAKELFAAGEYELVPVPQTAWHPQIVRVQTQQTVSVG